MAHDPILRLLRNLKKRKLIGKKLFAAARTKILPIAVLSDPNIRQVLVGMAANLGKQEQVRRKKEKRPFITRTREIVEDTALRVNELVFTVLGEAINALDAGTDLVQGGAIETLTDIPEEALRDTARTLAAMARAMRTGEK